MLPIQISKRARLTPASPIRRLAGLARQAKQNGKKVYHLNIGQPDVHTPVEFFAGIKEYDSQVVEYETSEGNHLLREAWSNYMERSLGIAVPPQSFLITTGASEALIFTFMITCDPGDEILIFDPTYANYIGFAAISGVDLIPVMTTIENGFGLPPLEQIQSQLTSRTRAILACNPNNPTGTVYSKEEIAGLLDLCNRNNIFLVVDEAYREFVYDGLTPYSVLELDPSNERIIVVDSLSKRFSLCGARIGALITPNQRVLSTGLSIAQARLAAPTIDQWAAAYMLNHISDEYSKVTTKEYEERRDRLFSRLSKIPGVEAFKPRGAFYTVARLPVAHAEDFAKFLLNDFDDNGETVFVAPASGFYQTKERGNDEIRLASVLSSQHLERAMEILEGALWEYKEIVGQ
jgi:aspartate aminotransferase